MTKKNKYSESIPLEQLKSESYYIDSEAVQRPLTDDQITEYNTTISHIEMNIMKRQMVLESIKYAVNNFTHEALINTMKELSISNCGDSGLKSCKLIKDQTLKILDRGYTEDVETIYGMFHGKENEMAIYDHDGIFLYSRELTKTELSKPHFEIDNSIDTEKFGDPVRKIESPFNPLVETGEEE